MSNKRSKAFEAVMQAHQETVDSMRQTVNQTHDAADIDETETHTMSAMSQQDEQTEMRNTLQIQLDAAEAELANVKVYETTEISGVQPGAFVETKDRIFFIGSSHRSIPFGKKEIIGMSTAAPAYSEIADLKKGDSFKLGSDKYTIEDIY